MGVYFLDIQYESTGSEANSEIMFVSGGKIQDLAVLWQKCRKFLFFSYFLCFTPFLHI